MAGLTVRSYKTSYYLIEAVSMAGLTVRSYKTSYYPYTLVMDGSYPYMDLNAKYEKLYYNVLRCVLLRLIQIRISPKQGNCT